MHKTHKSHNHVHGANCGHPAVQHDTHTDYLHDGHLHHVHDDHIDEHILAEGDVVAADCGGHDCETHANEHEHSAYCGHRPVPHEDHVDYLVDGHLHHDHGGHCDDHGAVKVV
ncbi:MAG: hypothetical protein ABR584_10290 [Candidatus Baltobacteraceae bacterium]